LINGNSPGEEGATYAVNDDNGVVKAETIFNEGFSLFLLLRMFTTSFLLCD
jgi:hypothetical protein